MKSFANLDEAMKGEADWKGLEAAIAKLPIVRLLGLEIRVESAEETSCRLVRVGPEHRGGSERTTLNGGVILAMLDAVSVVAGMIGAPGHRCATVDLNTQFVRPADPEGAVARAHVVRRARRLVFVRSELLNAAGDVCAVSQGLVMCVGRRKGGPGGEE